LLLPIFILIIRNFYQQPLAKRAEKILEKSQARLKKDIKSGRRHSKAWSILGILIFISALYLIGLAILTVNYHLVSNSFPLTILGLFFIFIGTVGLISFIKNYPTFNNPKYYY
jgi:type IV secretory pathway TrbL component